MKNRIVCLLLLLVISSTSLFAVVPSVKHYDESYFNSPGRLADVESSVPFGIALDASSDVKALSFLVSPVSSMQKSADALSSIIAGKSDEYINENYAAIASIFTFDSAFPTKVSDAALSAWNVREYLSSRYDAMDDANRSKAVQNAVGSSLGLFNGGKDYLGGDVDTSLAMYSEFIKNGFGWSVRTTLGFDSDQSWLSSYSYRNNDLYMNITASIGYSHPIVEDRLYAGFSVTPRALFAIPITNSALISTRTSADILTAFTGNIYFGLGADLNLGLYYKASDTLAFAVDYRNIPSIDTYWYLKPTEVLSGIKFHKDNELYMNIPDVALTVINDFGKLSLETETSDVFTVAAYSVLEDSFVRWSYIPKLTLTYELSSDFVLSTGYRYERLTFGIRKGGFNAELSAKVTELNFGFKLGYEF